MTKVFLIRHCEAQGQEPGAKLTEKGLLQAGELANVLGRTPIRRIISSPFERAVQSAKPLALACGLSIECDDRLRERALGIVDGDDWMAALRRTFDEPELAFPEGESTTAATARGRAVIDEALLRDLDPVALITHGNLLSLIAQSFDSSLGFDFWKGLKNPDIFMLQLENTGAVLPICRWRNCNE